MLTDEMKSIFDDTLCSYFILKFHFYCKLTAFQMEYYVDSVSGDLYWFGHYGIENSIIKKDNANYVSI